MKNCIPCWMPSPDSAQTCPACGEGSWSAIVRAAAPSPERRPEPDAPIAQQASPIEAKPEAAVEPVVVDDEQPAADPVTAPDAVAQVIHAPADAPQFALQPQAQPQQASRNQRHNNGPRGR